MAKAWAGLSKHYVVYRREPFEPNTPESHHRRRDIFPPGAKAGKQACM